MTDRTILVMVARMDMIAVAVIEVARYVGALAIISVIIFKIFHNISSARRNVNRHER